MIQGVKQVGANKFIVKDSTGKERVIDRDIKGIKNGDYLQGVASDKDAFIQKYGYHWGETKEDVSTYLRRRGMSDKLKKDGDFAK